MAFAGHRSCGFCILVLTSITPWLPRIYQTNSKPSCWGGFFNRICVCRSHCCASPLANAFRWNDIRSFGRRTEHQAALSQRPGRRHLPGDLAQAALRWRHFGSVAERSREEERTAVLPAFATRCIPVARTAVLLACPCSFRLSGQQDSKTRAAVLLTRALDRWLLVTSQLFASEKMLRPKRA